jgi:hypothetical protein
MKTRDLEVIIHDNSGENSQYQAVFGDNDDERLRYFFDPSPISMTENCERAVSRAEGAFVCMIGDDDGVLESVIDLARWMNAHEIEAAVVARPTYLWPGVVSVLDGAQTRGILRMPRCSGAIQVLEESDALKSVLRSGGIKIGDLPSVYHGVISKRALDKLKSCAGTYFPGPSPDMANAIGLSAVIDRFAKVGAPIVIAGVCASSGAAEGAKHIHQNEIAQKRFLPADTAVLWPAEVPFYFSGPTMYATSVVRALVATGRGELVARLRFDRLYAACAVFNPGYQERVDAVRARNPGRVSSSRFACAVAWVWWLRARALLTNIVQKTMGAARGDRRVTGLADIGEVINYLTPKSQRFHY